MNIDNPEVFSTVVSNHRQKTITTALADNRHLYNSNDLNQMFFPYGRQEDL